MVLGIFKFKFSFILFFAVTLSAAVHGIQMTKLCNRDMYIGQGRPVKFSHELRTHASLFKPYDINLGSSRSFLFSFPCLHCRWVMVMEFRAGRGQSGPVPFGLSAGPRSDL